MALLSSASTTRGRFTSMSSTFFEALEPHCSCSEAAATMRNRHEGGRRCFQMRPAICYSSSCPARRATFRFGRTTMNFSLKLVLGVVLGIAVGLFLGERAAALQVVADAYVKLLQMTVLPYVTVSIIASLGSLDLEQAKTLGAASGAVLSRSVAAGARVRLPVSAHVSRASDGVVLQLDAPRAAASRSTSSTSTSRRIRSTRWPTTSCPPWCCSPSSWAWR